MAFFVIGPAMTGDGPILVTGGAGYIGSHTVLALLERGLELIVIDDLSTGRRDLVPSDVLFIEGNVGDTSLVRHTLRDHGCSSVIHFAGSIVSPESFEKPLDYYANNTCASHALIGACVAEGVERFLFSSSAAVYGEAETLPIPEDHPTRPVSPYGASKLMTEWMLRDVSRQFGLRYGALRYFNVAGADAQGRSGQVGPATHLIKIAAEAAIGSRDGIQIFGDDYDTPDGTCIRDYIHVSDLAQAHLAGLDYMTENQAPLVVNCGYGHGYSVREVLDAVAKEAGGPINITVGPRRIGDVPALVAGNRAILDILPWRPSRDDLGLMVRSAMEWEQKQKAAS